MRLFLTRKNSSNLDERFDLKEEVEWDFLPRRATTKAALDAGIGPVAVAEQGVGDRTLGRQVARLGESTILVV